MQFPTRIYRRTAYVRTTEAAFRNATPRSCGSSAIRARKLSHDYLPQCIRSVRDSNASQITEYVSNVFEYDITSKQVVDLARESAAQTAPDADRGTKAAEPG